MLELKRTTPSNILWIDLEMTGLDATRDKILEVGAIITDWSFAELDSFESGVGQEEAVVEALMAENLFFKQFPENKKPLLELAGRSPSQSEVEDRLLELVKRHFPDDGPALLAGNSIHMDRQFIRVAWPRLEQRLHYRMLDVSAWKVVMLGKYGLEFPKKETHRALDDIHESIAELQFYLERFSKK